MSERLSVLERYPRYEAVIGIEVHVQLSTKSKIFCRCSNGPVSEANSKIDVVCCGHPGTLPVLNEQAVTYAVMAGLATNCAIRPMSMFSRKHYFYPDLTKGYQITQGDYPICQEGHVAIRAADGTQKSVRIMRIHMEEDAGKNTHVGGASMSLVDFNRAGSPLLEIVTYPDLCDAFEVRAYLKELHAIVMSLGITTGNMEEGAFRADTNVSVRKKGDPKLGTRCELKNINSFKFIADAVEYEIERQIQMVESGEAVRQQTRLWDTKNKRTFVMREKEDAADYRYFTDPDLPRLELSSEMIERVRSTMPELPAQKRVRLMSQYGLSEYEAGILVDDVQWVDYFEKAYQLRASSHIIKWILREVMGFAKEHSVAVFDLKFTAKHLAQLIGLLEEGSLTAKLARDVFDACVVSGQLPAEYVKEHGLAVKQISEADLREIIATIVRDNPGQAAEYKAGKEKLFGFFVGKVMAATKGAADPVIINALIKDILQGS